MGVYDEIRVERARQDERWGSERDAEHEPTKWCDIVATYLRLAAGEAWETRSDPEGYRGRMLQVAALAVAALEAYDRQPAAGDQEARP